ncbi:MAG: T9SS type A sorting domain-containing protein, partial [bacterium]
YGTASAVDTAYVICLTNDPSLPLASILVTRDVTVGIGDLEQLPTTFDISQNYPNPFNPTTTIKYQLPQVSDVRLMIYNVLGQRVRTLVNARVEAGYHQVVWDGLNEQGSAVASGVYIYRFEAGDFQKTMKLMLLK